MIKDREIQTMRTENKNFVPPFSDSHRSLLLSSRQAVELFSFREGEKMDKKCLRCPDYIHKQDNADLLENAFGQSGIWNFKTCHATCWREKDKKGMYESNKYRYKVGLAVFR